MEIRKRAYKPEILLSVTKNEYGCICLKPTKILNKLEFEVFDKNGHGGQDEAINLMELGVGLTQDELNNLITIVDRDISKRRGRDGKFGKELKKELRRIRKFLVNDKEHLSQEKKF